MTFIDPEMGWFEITEVPIIDQSADRISQIINEVYLSRYPRLRKVIFYNGSEFKMNFISLIKYYYYKIHMQILSWREFTKFPVACSRPKIWTMSSLTQLPRGARFLRIFLIQYDDHIIAHDKIPLKISLWLWYDPRHQFLTKLKVDVAKEEKNLSIIIISVKNQSECNTTMRSATTHTF